MRAGFRPAPPPAPPGALCSAARTATRGESGGTGSSPSASSTSSEPRQSLSRSTPESSPRPASDLRQRLGRDPVERERDRVERAGDERRPGPHRLERCRQRRARPRPGSAGRPGARSPPPSARPAPAPGRGRASPTGSWMSTREAPSSVRLMGALERAPRSRLPARGCGRARPPAPSRRRGWRPRRRSRLPRSLSGSWSRKTSIPLLGRALDEAANEVARERPRADEKAAAERHPERRRAARRGSPGSAPKGFPHRVAPRCRSSHRRRPRGTRSRPRRGPPRARTAAPAENRSASGSCERSRIVVSTSCGTDYAREM